MKTLCKDGISLYLFADAMVLVQSELGTDVGDPAEYRIGDCRSTDSVIHEGVTAPADWASGVYLFDGNSWTVNQEILTERIALLKFEITTARDKAFY